ncbi:site-specific DNA-methyltransferase [candidate division KSB1 bacterium]|nr:site-specific DNA-methyltransferase [bacterium]NUM67892.1 site-specific DNA-methyltransferase [candidate division KSB1 bacterium]
MPESNNKPSWGPDNPHPLAKMKTELVWEGKYDEYGNRRPVKLPASDLPLQRIETIDEPHDRAKAAQGSLFDHAEFSAKAHRDDFRNMLIWGDNKLAMASLLERFRGKIDLIYIDPPFDVGADFTMQVQIGEEGEALQKEQSILEAVAYRDTWGKGTDSYLHMMYERLTLMRDLLSERGSIYVHCDWHVSHLLRSLLDDVFSPQLFQNEIIWKRTTGHSDSATYGHNHDCILFYAKSETIIWNNPKTQYEEWYIERYYRYTEPNGRRFMSDNLSASGLSGGGYYYKWKGKDGYWRCPKSTMEKLDADGRIFYTKNNIPRYKRYLDEMEGLPVQTIWDDLQSVVSWSPEAMGYNTQKPEGIAHRILSASSNEGDLVADFFCGSGTTLAVAEKLGRRWIGVDLGRYAIHTTRKRLIQVQRELHEKGQPYRSFDVYNLGRYERQWWQMERLAGADEEHRRIVLDFYKAAPLGSTGSPTKGSTSSLSHPLLHGTKHGAFVHVDQIDGLFTFEELRTVAEAAQAAGSRELHCLAWEFEMELQHKKQAVEAETGLTIRLKYIPREIMEPNRTECQFFEAGALEVKVLHRNKKIDIALQHFTPALAEAPEMEMEALRKRAVKSPFDFIDFWAVDFEWHANKPFEHHWQDFRTRKDRSLKTKTDIGWEYKTSGKKQICVKVIDVFGVDTTTVVEVDI